MSDQRLLPDPNEMPTISVEVAAKCLGIGRGAAYAQAGEYLRTDGASGLPCFRMGRTIRVLTAELRRLLRVDGYPA
jgi:hypothetical protein